MKTQLLHFYQQHHKESWFRFIDNLIFRITAHEVFPTGGMLAYFLVLSIFPFLIALLNILNFTPLVDGDFLNEAITYLPEATRSVILSFIREISSGSSTELLGISLIAGLWSASSGIRHLIRKINRAYSSLENRNFFQLSLIALLFTVGLIILIILLLLTQIFGEKILMLLNDTFTLDPEIIRIANQLSTLIPPAYMVLFFVALYGYSPNNRSGISLKTTLPGALFATFGIILVTTGFTFYVNNFGNYTVTYGSLAGAIILLLWLYIISITIVLGGEIAAIVRDMKTGEHMKGSFMKKLLNINDQKEPVR